MGKVEIRLVVPPTDESALSEALRWLTQQAHQHGADKSGGVFGGEFGYGANCENDVFLMHPFCWCESETCLWCGGSHCLRLDFEDIQHAPTCYQERLQALKQKYGRQDEWGWDVPIGHKPYARDRRALCRELGCDPKFGSEIHCTCGAKDARQRQYDACQCDWHLGRGIYRFGPAKNAPHFWHKPTGLQVRWYKYIGRDMEIDYDGGDLTVHALMDSCLASLGTDIKTAWADYRVAQARSIRASRAAARFYASPEGQAEMDKMFASGAIKVFTGTFGDMKQAR